jgi:hypothetical protein
LLYQVGDLFELNVKLQCLKAKVHISRVCCFTAGKLNNLENKNDNYIIKIIVNKLLNKHVNETNVGNI